MLIMSKKSVLFLWLVAAVLGGLVFTVKSNQDAPSKTAALRKTGQTLLESFPAEKVTAIVVAGAGDETHLHKRDGKWANLNRDRFPANTKAINDLLRTIAELKVAGAVEEAAGFPARFGIEEPSGDGKGRGITVTFSDADGTELAKISVGKAIGDAEPNPLNPLSGGAGGRFILNHADKSAIYKVTEMFGALSEDPKTWLDQEFISIEKPKTIAVTQPGKDDLAWKLTREDESAEFALEGATPEDNFDPAQASALKNVLSSARFDDVVPTLEASTRGLTDQKRTATIETVEGFTYTIEITPTKPAENAAEGAAPDSYLLTVEVEATLPTERKKEADEKPEDAKAKDEAFASRLKTLEEKLEKEEAFAGRTFQVASYVVDGLIKDRSSFKTPGHPGADAQQGGLPPGAAVPEGLRRAPVEATTPPIAVPQESEEPTEKEGE
jgi:hypothetical protein